MAVPIRGSGRVCVLWESGERRLVLRWCVWQECFTLSLLITKFLKVCTSNAVSKYNAAMYFSILLFDTIRFTSVNIGG
jgi:hypothetical protein